MSLLHEWVSQKEIYFRPTGFDGGLRGWIPARQASRKETYFRSVLLGSPLVRTPSLARLGPALRAEGALKGNIFPVRSCSGGRSPEPGPSPGWCSAPRARGAPKGNIFPVYPARKAPQKGIDFRYVLGTWFSGGWPACRSGSDLPHPHTDSPSPLHRSWPGYATVPSR